MTDNYQAALANLGGSPASDSPGTQAAPDTTPAPAAQPTPSSTSFDLPDQTPLEDVMSPLSDEEKFDLAQQQQAAAADPNAQPATPATPTDPTQQSFDEIGFFTEKTGGKFKSWDEINEALSAAPKETIIEKPVAPTFANDESKKLYDAIVAGKLDEVTPIFEQRARYQALSSGDADSALAARIKEQYPSLTAQQVQYHLERTYGVKEEDYENDPIGLETAKTMAADKKAIDAEMAKKYFSDKLSDLVLPDFSPAAQPASAQPVGPDFNNPEVKKTLEFAKGLAAVAVTDKIPFEFTTDSPVNPITVKGDIPLEPGKIQEYMDAIGENPDVVILSRYFDDQGNFRKDVFAKGLYLEQNFNTLVQKAVSQAVVQTQEEMLRRNRNYPQPAAQRTGGFDSVQEAEASRSQLERFFNIPAAQPGSPV